MSGLGPEKITTQQRFNRVQEDLDLIYSRLKETADELQASRTRVTELEIQNGGLADQAIKDRREAGQLRARMAELECRITDGFTGFSDGGLYAHIDLDADFYDSIPK